jgi:hypothetical protein
MKKIAFDHFNNILGSPSTRSATINLDFYQLPQLDSAGLDSRFIEEEVWLTIRALHPDKSPGPDGFIARFLQAAWDIVRPNFRAALDVFWRRDTRDLHAANEALMTLLPKSSEVATIADYRPISLIHIVGKLISKLLANGWRQKWALWCIYFSVPLLRAILFTKISDLCDRQSGYFTPIGKLQFYLRLI